MTNEQKVRIIRGMIVASFVDSDTKKELLEFYDEIEASISEKEPTDD